MIRKFEIFVDGDKFGVSSSQYELCLFDDIEEAFEYIRNKLKCKEK